MIRTGQEVNDLRGHIYFVGHELGAGGQGVVFEAYDRADPPAISSYVIKANHPGVTTRDARERLEALVKLNLSACSPALCAPLAELSGVYGVAAVQPRAAGQPLEELLVAGTYRLQDAVGIALALCRALAVLDAMGVAHGDLAASNVFVRRMSDYFEIALIDFDNASIPGAPAPSFRGQDMYAAPELLAGTTTATVTSDRFSLAVLLHELLLRRHPFTGAAQGSLDFASYVALLSKASWQEDPIEGNGPEGLSGPPVGVLPREVQQLFRRGLARDPFERPSAETWGHALERMRDELFVCDGCHEEFANDPARYMCPWCETAADALELQVNGRSIPLGAMTTAIGRDEVGGDSSVSRNHAVIRRRGFALSVRCTSSNHLAIHTGGGWRELAEGEETIVSTGDRIMFAPGVEGVVRSTPSP